MSNTAKGGQRGARMPQETPAERMAWDAYEHDPTDATRNALVELYLPWVRDIASHFRRRLAPSGQTQVGVDDLASVGAMALMRWSIPRFDRTAGARFTSYAHGRLVGSFLDELRRLDPMPKAMRAAVKAGELEGPQTFNLWAGGDQDSSADSRGQAQDDDGQWQGGHMEDADVDAMVGGELVRWRSQRAQDPAEEVAAADAIGDLLGELDERAQQVVLGVYRDCLTLRQIGEQMGVSESRVSQIHRQALAVLRANLGEGDDG